MEGFVKLPAYFTSSETALNDYNKLIDKWEAEKNRAEDLGIPFSKSKPELVLEDLPKELKDKYVNKDYIVNFWRATETGLTSIQMFDDIVYEFQVKFEDFLKIIEGDIINK